METNWFDELLFYVFREDIYKEFGKPIDYEDTCNFVIEKLPKNVQLIIKQKFKYGHNGSEIARNFGWTQQYVNQELRISRSKIQRMKEFLLKGKLCYERQINNENEELIKTKMDLITHLKNSTLHSETTLDDLCSFELLSVRSWTALQKFGFITIGDVKDYILTGYTKYIDYGSDFFNSFSPKEKILRIKNIGEKSANEILELVARCN